jgi:hypothetical protein
MAHYAFLEKEGFVTEVIRGRDETEVVDGISNWETYYGNLRNQKCVRTSIHGNIRKNFAGLGFFYDVNRDAFISPNPYDSWVLNENTCRWQAPVPRPETGSYYWDEQSQSWVEFESGT